MPAKVPGGRKELQILRMIKVSSLNGLPLDILIAAGTGLNSMPIEFAIVFADQRP